MNLTRTAISADDAGRKFPTLKKKKSKCRSPTICYIKQSFLLKNYAWITKCSKFGALMKVDATVAQPPIKIIKPSHGWVPIRLDALWVHRELFYFLVWRDIKVRYKQTLLGVLWAVLQPLTLM